jgi:YebC/PmpR family DNA-binding regulatory protein
MAGHSQFKNIMYRKGAQDKKRARLFTRIAREIMAAARSGLPDPESNPRLRSAMAAARAANMPKDNIARTIKRATGGGDDTSFAEVRYEGYGPGGVAVIVEALTDNRNRTASSIRTAFNKHGGNLGETNSVSFMFQRVGSIAYPAAAATADAMFEAALDAGATDVASTDDGHAITSAPEDFYAVRETLEGRFGAPSEAQLVWKPSNTVPIAGDMAGTLLKLLEALEEDDDVQSVSANFDIAEDELRRLSA